MRKKLLYYYSFCAAYFTISFPGEGWLWAAEIVYINQFLTLLFCRKKRSSLQAQLICFLTSQQSEMFAIFGLLCNLPRCNLQNGALSTDGYCFLCSMSTSPPSLSLYSEWSPFLFFLSQYGWNNVSQTDRTKQFLPARRLKCCFFRASWEVQEEQLFYRISPFYLPNSVWHKTWEISSCSEECFFNSWLVTKW